MRGGIKTQPADRAAIEQRLNQTRHGIVFCSPMNEYLVTVGNMELVPVIVVMESRQVIEICLRSPKSEEMTPIIYECKNLIEARAWIERLQYIVVQCMEGEVVE
jgi:hypothetical protein